ncbi:ATP-binding cassette domain-containing protein [Caldiplasma sukawensis]
MMQRENERDTLHISKLFSGYRNGKEYIEILKNVEINAKRGEIIGITGRSGSGKTTLLRVIMGELYRSDGDILFDGESIFSKDNYFEFRKKRILVRQESFDMLRPRYSIDFQIRKMFKNGEYPLEKLKEIFQSLNIDEDVLHMLPVQLSDGNKQRVLIAMALLADPEILLMDEPTSGLDAMAIIGLLKLLKERRNGRFTIMISNDIIPLFQICDRIYIMENGRVIEDGPWDRILEKPAHPLTAEIITHIPVYENRNNKLHYERREGSYPCIYGNMCTHMGDECMGNIEYKREGEHGYLCNRYPDWYGD